MLEITSPLVKAISPVRADFFWPMPSTHLSPLYLEAPGSLSQRCWGWRTAHLGRCSLSALLLTVSLPPLFPCCSCCFDSKEGEHLREIHIVPELFSLIVQWENFPFYSPKSLCWLYQQAAGALVYFMLPLKHTLHQVFMQTGNFLHKRHQWLNPNCLPGQACAACAQHPPAPILHSPGGRAAQTGWICSADGAWWDGGLTNGRGNLHLDL